MNKTKGCLIANFATVPNGSIVEYQSVRTKPEPEQVLAAEKLYAQLRSGKAARPKLAASFSVKILLL
ncbi:hypothetical protein, partial [Escherichia sp. NIC18-1]